MPPPPIEGRVALPEWQALRARGADAASFLQGQLTNDVLAMDERSLRLAGFCSAKGRLQASFLVWRPAEDEFVLACATSVAAATLKRLSMFVLRAKCRLTDAADEVRLHGAVGTTALAAAEGLAPWERKFAVGGIPSVLRLPDVDGIARCIIVTAGSVDLDDVPNLGPAPSLAPDVWQRLEVRSGIARIEAATADRFVPQMINFEAVGGVDFQKGCYPGQEIVARSQYRGTLKRRMFVYECDAAATPGAEVFDAADPTQPAGMVVNAAPAESGSGSVALVEVKLAAREHGGLRLGAVDGPALRGGTLPYELPPSA